MSSLPLPEGLVWYAHRVNGSRHLGIYDPDAGSFRDAGPRLDYAELADLAGGVLCNPRSLLEASKPMADRPVFDVPVAHPSKILCLGKNFAAHAAEFGAEVPEEPIFFTKFADTLIPDGADIILPHWVDSRIDHELELAVILGFEDSDGRGRKYVAAAHAMDLVAGYTVLNDVTARQIQGDDRGKQRPWLRSKSFDSFCPIGPWVVPASERTQLGNLSMRLHVNEELRQSSSTDLMVVDIPTAIEFLSRHTTLRPGDILAMGTPEGVGPIDDGDIVSCFIETIGTLRNPVAREAAPGE
ncbi:MAG: fumarylacetoacetate hydrolase family protein [Planctomycetota bacterium]|nr:fumarylacetoacetate hydrolase family protein [Planctomycetota bacterium]